MLEEGGRALSFPFSFLLMLGWSGVLEGVSTYIPKNSSSLVDSMCL